MCCLWHQGKGRGEAAAATSLSVEKQGTQWGNKRLVSRVLSVSHLGHRVWFRVVNCQAQHIPSHPITLGGNPPAPGRWPPEGSQKLTRQPPTLPPVIQLDPAALHPTGLFVGHMALTSAWEPCHVDKPPLAVPKGLWAHWPLNGCLGHISQFARSPGHVPQNSSTSNEG